jgi:membrane protease YdiL (CAAX protease family)
VPAVALTGRGWHGGRMVTGSRRRRALWLVLAVGLAWNVVGNLWLPHALYVPGALATALAVLVIAVAVGGCRARELGLGVRRLGSGLRYGLAAGAVVAAALVAAAAIPALRPWLTDTRADLTLGGVLFAALVRVPLGTVALEETLFRGVLPALLARGRRTALAAAGWSSVLFAAWHILPARHVFGAKPVLDELGGGSIGRVLLVAGLVALTGVAGVALCWLRLASGSLLAPAIVHTAANSLSYLLAWVLLYGSRLTG